jgi:hypothetical protein
MNLKNFATRIASIVDLEIFQNHCGMVYSDALPSNIITSQLSLELSNQKVPHNLVHTKTLLGNQKNLDNLGITTDLNIVYGFEDLICFGTNSLNNVLNPTSIQFPKDSHSLNDLEFLTKYSISKHQLQEFIDSYDEYINSNFEKSLKLDHNLINTLKGGNPKFELDTNNICDSKLLGILASCYIQGLNFRPFSKFIIVLPQQLAKILYEFKPYNGLFDNCKDGYGVMGLDSNWSYLTTFGNKTSFQGPLNIVLEQYSVILQTLNDNIRINNSLNIT